MNKWQRIDEQNNKRRKRIYNEHNGIKTKQTEECLMEMHEIDSEGINSYPEDNKSKINNQLIEDAKVDDSSDIVEVEEPIIELEEEEEYPQFDVGDKVTLLPDKIDKVYEVIEVKQETDKIQSCKILSGIDNLELDDIKNFKLKRI